MSAKSKKRHQAQRKTGNLREESRLAPAPGPGEASSEKKGQGKLAVGSALVVSAAVMCSRVLGLGREILFNRLFGAAGMDLFVTAFRIPNLLRDLFAEGALSTAFVTVFSQKLATEGEKSAWNLANKMLTLTAVFMSAVTVAGVLLAPLMVGAMGFSPERTAQATLLTQVMYPFILLVSLAALVMGLLNARKVFGVPAMASSFFNIGSIVGGIGLGWWLDPDFGAPALLGLAIGTLIGGFLQLAVQWPSLGRAGYRFRLDFNWRDEGVGRILRTMGPAVVAASAVQVNVLVNTTFATYLEPGAVAWLNSAFRLMQLPIGVFGVAIATVTLPQISADAALSRTDDFRSSLARGLRLALLLTIPCTAGLVLLAEPISSLLYGGGKMTPHDIAAIADAMKFYVLGMAAYAGIKVLAPAFYALNLRRTPMMVSFFAIVTNLVLNGLFTFSLGMGHRGLALSTGLVALSNFILLYWLMARRIGGLESRLMASTLARVLAATAGLSVICWLGVSGPLAWAARFGLAGRIAGLGAVIAIAALVFAGLAWALRLREINDLVALARKRLLRRRS